MWSCSTCSGFASYHTPRVISIHSQNTPLETTRFESSLVHTREVSLVGWSDKGV